MKRTGRNNIFTGFIAVLMIILAAGQIPAEAVVQSEYLTPLTKNGAMFDYRAEAGQKLYKYDTLQGACANNGYAYLTLRYITQTTLHITRRRIS